MYNIFIDYLLREGLLGEAVTITPINNLNNIKIIEENSNLFSVDFTPDNIDYYNFMVKNLGGMHTSDFGKRNKDGTIDYSIRLNNKNAFNVLSIVMSLLRHYLNSYNVKTIYVRTTVDRRDVYNLIFDRSFKDYTYTSNEYDEVDEDGIKYCGIFLKKIR